jgi:hypothetical protein
MSIMKHAAGTAECTARHVARALACLVLFHWLAAIAEPRPAPYGGGADHYSDTRLAIRESRWTQAQDALQRLAREMPQMTQDAEYHNLMGYSLRRQNPANLERSIDHYLTALRLDPSHVQAREYLGEAYLMQGREDLAREQLRAIEDLCKSRTCEEWRDLDRAIEAYRARR